MAPSRRRFRLSGLSFDLWAKILFKE